MPAGVAANAGETVMRVAAFDEASDGPLLHLALKPPGGSQFLRMAYDALVKGARARVARPIDPAAWRNGISTGHPPSNARGDVARVRSTALEDMASASKRVAFDKR